MLRKQQQITHGYYLKQRNIRGRELLWFSIATKFSLLTSIHEQLLLFLLVFPTL